MKKTKRLMELEQRVENLAEQLQKENGKERRAIYKAIEKAILKLGEEYVGLMREIIGKRATPEWVVEGLEKVAELYIDYGIDVDGKDALFYLAQAYLAKGDSQKHKKICELYISYLGLELNEAKWIALNNLACRFEDGQGVEKDVKLSLGIFKLLAHLGCSYGWLNLAEYYEEGKETEKDVDGAIEIYKGLLKKGLRDGSKELARQRLARHNYTEYDLDELENSEQIEDVANYMEGNFVWLELFGNHIMEQSVDSQDLSLVASLSDEGLIDNEISEIFKTLKQGENLKRGMRNREKYPIDLIQSAEIDIVRKFIPQFGAWADAWEKLVRILENERKNPDTTERKNYYFIIKRPSGNAVSKITDGYAAL